MFMKSLFCCALGLLISATSASTPRSPAGSTPIKGDYVEARTASVFAGACHYNGELVTTATKPSRPGISPPAPGMA